MDDTQATVSLVDLMNGEEDAVYAFHAALSSNGWMVLKVTEELGLVQRVEEVRQPLEELFGANRDDHKKKSKMGYRHPFTIVRGQNGFGYLSFTQKQVYRVLTGAELPVDYPPGLEGALPLLATMLEEVLVKLVVQMPLDIEELRKSVPLLSESERARFAMLDASYYMKNKDKTKRAEGGRCEAHYDPGVLSISVLSTHEGLMLQRGGGEWVSAPIERDAVIVWAGAAAASAAEEGKIRAAYHRVDIKKKERMTVWMEMCTIEQAFPQAVQVKEGGVIEIENISIFGGEQEPYRVKLQEGGVTEACLLVEELRGLPASKIMKRVVYDREGYVIDTTY